MKDDRMEQPAKLSNYPLSLRHTARAVFGARLAAEEAQRAFAASAQLTEKA